MRKYLFIVFLLFSGSILCQNTTETEALFSKNINSFFKNPSQTIRVANYLYENATTNNEKAKALYLLSESQKQQGDYIESIENLFKAKALLRPNEHHFINALLLVSIAERCRISGVNDISKNYLQQAETHLDKIRNKQEMIFAKARVLHEKADANYQINQFSKAIALLQESEKRLEDIQETYPSMLVFNAILQGSVYTKQTDFDTAMRYYNSAWNILKESELLNSSLEAEVLYGIATIQHLKKEHSAAEENLIKAVSIPVVEKPIKVEVLNQLSLVYKEKDSIAGYQERYKESSELSAVLFTAERKARNTILSQIQEEQKTAISVDQKRYYFIGGIIISIVVLSLLVYYFYNKKLDRQHKQFEKIIKQLENKEKIEAPKKVVQEVSETPKGITIPEETENSILQRLEDFEASSKYTNSNMSLGMLAKQMQTNTKYISEIIHTHKNKNFNTYINELRINHIIQLMKEDKKYL